MKERSVDAASAESLVALAIESNERAMREIQQTAVLGLGFERANPTVTRRTRAKFKRTQSH